MPIERLRSRVGQHKFFDMLAETISEFAETLAEIRIDLRLSLIHI